MLENSPIVSICEPSFQAQYKLYPKGKVNGTFNGLPSSLSEAECLLFQGSSILKRKRSNFFYKIINCIFFYLQRILLNSWILFDKMPFFCIVIPVNELRKLEKPVTRAAPAGAVSFLRRFLWHQTEILLWIINLKSNI